MNNKNTPYLARYYTEEAYVFQRMARNCAPESFEYFRRRMFGSIDLARRVIAKENKRSKK